MDEFKINKILENQKVLNAKLDIAITMLLSQQDFNNVQSFITGLSNIYRRTRKAEIKILCFLF